MPRIFAALVNLLFVWFFALPIIAQAAPTACRLNSTTPFCVVPSYPTPEICNEQCAILARDAGTTGTCIEPDACPGGSPPLPAPGQTKLEGGGGFLFDISVKIVGKTISFILQIINAILVWLVGYTAQLFDISIAIALAGFSDLRFITVGWELVRDVANIFFIFVLLIIAIATILRLESYGWKQLLAKLIVVALLINFSMVIASVVIDASNLLALQFIERIYPVSDKIAVIMGFSKITTHDPTGVPGDPEMPLTEALSNGWNNVLRMFSFAPVKDPTAVQALAFGIADNEIDADIAQMFFHVLVFILLLTAIFIFVALSALILIRSVTLMILLIFAPFGFLAYVLPVTRSISSMWWNKLFSQSFFLPACAFMLYLSIYYGMEVAQMSLPGSHTFNTAILFNYFVIFAMLLGSIIVARYMGAYGASAAIGMGNKLKGKLQGYAGRTTRAGIYAVGRANARALGGEAGRISEKLGEKGFLGRVVAKPFAALQAAGEKAVKGREKIYEDAINRSDTAFQARYAAAVTPQERATARRVAIEKGKAHLLSPADRQAEYALATRTGPAGNAKAARNIEAVDPSIAALNPAVTTGTITAQESVRQAMARMSTKDIEERMSAASLNAKSVQDAILLAFGGQQLKALAEHHGAAAATAANTGFAALGGASAVLDRMKSDNRDGLKAFLTSPGIGIAFPDIKNALITEIASRLPTIPATQAIDDFIKSL